MSDAKPRKSPTGRLVVYSVFWSVAAAVTIAIVGSVGYSLYGRPPTPGTSEATYAKRHRDWCLRTLVGLRDELELEVTHELAYTTKKRPPMARWNAWVDDWKTELDDATARCATGHDEDMTRAYTELRLLYDGYQVGVSQIAESRRRRSQTLEDAVQKLSRSP